MLTAEEWNRLTIDGGLIDLSEAPKLRLSGPDALRYLNGQVSNDVRRIEPGGPAMPACLCTHKGKLEALVLICRDAAGDFFLTADAALRDFLPLRVDKYLIADNAVLEDVTDDYALIHAFGPAPLPPMEPAGPGKIPASRVGLPGTDLWLAPGAANGLIFSSKEAVEALRIDRSIPAWETELADDILPPEAHLEQTAIDYHKGCYTGQEVISRLRSVGRVNKQLIRLESSDGRHLEAGMELITMATDGSEQNAGRITSAAWHPILRTGIALAYLKRSAAGAPLLANSSAGTSRIPVEIRKPLDDSRP